jgi:hypothetical protein
MLFKSKTLLFIKCCSGKTFSNAVGWAVFMTKLFDVESELRRINTSLHGCACASQIM